MQSSSSDRDFAQYNAAQEGRDVRPLALAAVAAAGPASVPAPMDAAELTNTARPMDAAELTNTARPTNTARLTDAAWSTDAARSTGARSAKAVGARRVAIELGCGRGIETRYLAECGYTVHAYDVDPSVAPEMEALAAELPVQHASVDLAEITALPSADLILACVTLPFIPRASFDDLWRAMWDALRPGGVLAVDLFGDRDDWAGTDGTFLSRAEVETLLEGVEVLSLEERERDGDSFQGPKHWHTYRILARRI